MYSLGRVTAVSGAQMTVEADQPLASSVRIGAMIKTRSVDHEVVGTISAVQVDGGSPPRSVFVVDLLGEIVASVEGQVHRPWELWTREAAERRRVRGETPS